MTPKTARDPIDRLSRAERRSWRAAVRQAERAHEDEQMATLRELAATGRGITGVMSTTGPSGLTDTVEMFIEGQRLRAFHVHRPTMVALKEALSHIAAVPLTRVSRYGHYWVLTFRTATEPLVVLVDRLIIVPDWGGGFGWATAPTGPALHLAG